MGLFCLCIGLFCGSLLIYKRLLSLILRYNTFVCLSIGLLCGSLLSIYRSLLWVSFDLQEVSLAHPQVQYICLSKYKVCYVGLFCLCIDLFCWSHLIYKRLLSLILRYNIYVWCVGLLLIGLCWFA